MEKIENAFEDVEVSEDVEDIVIDYVEVPEVSGDEIEIPEVNEVVESNDEDIVADEIETESFEEVVETEVTVEPVNDNEPADIPITRGFNVNTNDLQFDGFEDIDSGIDIDEPPVEPITDDVPSYNEEDSVNDSFESSTSFFESIESISTDDEDEKPKKKGFFSKWK